MSGSNTRSGLGTPCQALAMSWMSSMNLSSKASVGIGRVCRMGGANRIPRTGAGMTRCHSLRLAGRADAAG